MIASGAVKSQDVKYTRGAFIFTGAQSFPHRSFVEEVSFWKNSLECLVLVEERM